MRGVFAGILVLSLTACAPFTFVQPDIQGQPIEVLCDPNISTPGQILITSVDGRSTERFFSNPSFASAATVSGGRHYLGLVFGYINTRADGKIWFDAEAGKHYMVHDALKDYRVLFWIEERESGKAVGGIPGSEPEKQVAVPPQAPAPMAQPPPPSQAQTPAGPVKEASPTAAPPASDHGASPRSGS